MFKIFILIIAISCFNFNISNSTEIDEAKKMIKQLENFDFDKLNKQQQNFLTSIIFLAKMSCVKAPKYRMCSNNNNIICYDFDNDNTSLCLSNEDVKSLSDLLIKYHAK